MTLGFSVKSSGSVTAALERSLQGLSHPHSTGHDDPDIYSRVEKEKAER